MGCSVEISQSACFRWSGQRRSHDLVGPDDAGYFQAVDKSDYRNAKNSCIKPIKAHVGNSLVGSSLVKPDHDDTYSRTPHAYSWINVSGGFRTEDSNEVDSDHRYECRVDVENGLNGEPASIKLLSLEVDGHSLN